MNTDTILVDHRPLATFARPARGRPHVRRAILLAAGDFLHYAAARVQAELLADVGLTRTSPIIVAALPPHRAAQTLDELTDVDEMSRQGARIAVDAPADGGQPWLWLFVAECHVLWPQLQPAALRGLS